MAQVLQSHETALVGSWFIKDGQALGDETCERIEWLTKHHLKKVALSKDYGAWETLFQDPNDGRYWERTYPHSEMHGGGPPRLVLLSAQDAMKKYQL